MIPLGPWNMVILFEFGKAYCCKIIIKIKINNNLGTLSSQIALVLVAIFSVLELVCLYPEADNNNIHG